MSFCRAGEVSAASLSDPGDNLTVMVILFDMPVDLSSAETFRMPLASTLKVTSTWGTPRLAGGMPRRSNSPRRLLSFVRLRSPSKMVIGTEVWLSRFVVKSCDLRAGTVVLRSMMRDMMPPTTSMPSESGATSIRIRSFIGSERTFVRIAAWTAAP